MRIILLKGDDNVGKSTVLNAVFDELISFHGVTHTPKRELGAAINRDFESIITLKDKRKVAFFTMGDIEKDLQEGLEKYKYLDCEVLIVAINNQHVNLLNSITDSYPHNLIEKSNPFRNITSMWKDVGNILSLI